MAEDVTPASVSKFNKFKQRFEESATDNTSPMKSGTGFKLPNGAAVSPAALKPKPTSPQTESDTSDKSDNNNNNPPFLKPKPKVPGKLNINSLFQGENIEQLGTRPKPSAKPSVEAKPDLAKKPAVLPNKPSLDSDKKTESSDAKSKILSPNKSPVFNSIAEEISKRKEEGRGLKSACQENTELKSPTSPEKSLPSTRSKVPSVSGQTDFRKKLKSIDDGKKDPIKLPVSKPPELVNRSCDNKQFKRIKLLNRFAYGNPPEKPKKLLNIDINSIINKKNNPEEPMWGGDEIYDDVEELRPVNSRQSFRPVSEIKPMSEEEENEQEVYDDGLSVAAARDAQNVIKEEPDEVYDDCAAANPEDEPGEIYEDMDDLILSRVDPPTEEQETEEQKAKREEKERKKKEKEEKEKEKEKKKEEKRREEEKKKKEDEEKRIKKLFKLTGSEEAVAKGTVKEDAKGSKLDLGVKAGQEVSVMRMIDNPAGKFLCQTTEGKWGYVESRNFSIHEDTLKKVTETELIKAQNKNSTTSGGNIVPEDDDNQEIYEDCIFEDDGA